MNSNASPSTNLVVLVIDWLDVVLFTSQVGWTGALLCSGSSYFQLDFLKICFVVEADWDYVA